MKIIEGLKKLKRLVKKAEDLREKIAKHCSHYDYEKEVYPEQRKKITGWLQAHADITKEILKLRLAIQRTNIEIDTSVKLNGKPVRQSIAAWIHRRRDLAKLEVLAWSSLQDTDIAGRPLKESRQAGTSGEGMDVKITRHYDPEERDNHLAALMEEPSIIDGHLEVINATTELNYYESESDE